MTNYANLPNLPATPTTTGGTQSTAPAPGSFEYFQALTGSGSLDQASRGDLARTSRSRAARNQTIAAAGSVIPVPYGRDAMGARIALVASSGQDLLVLCVIGHGPIS